MRKMTVLLVMILVALTSCTEEDATVQASPSVRKTYPIDEKFQVLTNGVIQGTKSAYALSPTELESDYYSKPLKWKLSTDISDMPQFDAPQFPLLVTLYNMALEESKLDILKKEQAFMAGKQWTGIWTRDISYSIHLGLAYILPNISENSLRAKVNDIPAVIQDTGTGGSWPISTDRVVWAIAAWEVYLVTGNIEFLKYAYTVLKNTALTDRRIAYEEATGLYKGESSFMDWREQSYPLWMQPADIYESKSLSTCVLHAALHDILAKMGTLLGVDEGEIEEWSVRAESLKVAINEKLWLSDKKYYSCYRYPEVMGGLLSDKTDTLGETLAVLYNVADTSRAKQVVENTPVVNFGIPCLSPQQPHAGPYHNKGIWPFVNAYYVLAGAKVQNHAAVEHGILSIVRAAAFFATHKENFSSHKGHSIDTAINSDRQLWSVAGYLALVYRVFFGIEMSENGLSLKPFVPDFIKGNLKLTAFPYRGAKLTITVKGNGDTVKSYTLDKAKKNADYVLPTDLKGEHQIEIELTKKAKGGKINLEPAETIAPYETEMTATVTGKSVALSWKSAKDAVKYRVYKNGSLWKETEATNLSDAFNEDDEYKSMVYSVQGINAKGIPANLSRYVIANPEVNKIIIEAENAQFNSAMLMSKGKGFSDKGYVKTVNETAEKVEFTLNIKQSGTYFLRFRYANGNGPINTENKCAIRSIALNGEDIATVIFPQRGHWDDWGYSSPFQKELEEGQNVVTIFYDQYDQNMNKVVNNAYVDYLEAILIK